jgi:hypothetical protein
MPSSSIRAIGYEKPTRSLIVGFVSGAVYAYRNVPEAVYLAFKDAPSKGRFFASEIRPRYTDFEQIRDAD